MSRTKIGVSKAGLVHSAIGVVLATSSLLAGTVFKDKVPTKARRALFGVSLGWTLADVVETIARLRRQKRYANVIVVYGDELEQEE